MSAIQPLLGQTNSSSSVQKVIAQKEANMKAKLANTWERYHPGMIGGDGLTMAYLGFTAAEYFAPSLQSISWVGWMTSTVGEIGGAINVWVAYQEFKEAYTAFQCGDKLNGWKMVFDASFFMAIGFLMIFVSMAVKVGALGSLGAFFAANPWILPVLFFVITIPLITEIGIRVLRIATKSDLGSQLNLRALKEVVEQGNDVQQWLKNSPFGSFTNLSDKMEEFQADMGVEAALEAFKLFQMLIDQQNAQAVLDQIEKAQQKINEWNNAQYVRLFQQVLYVLAFIICMGAFAPGSNGNAINGVVNVGMSLANLIPLGMDICWPFKRNVPMVVARVEQN